MVLKGDGTVWATGANGFGQLGDGTTSYKQGRENCSSAAKAAEDLFHRTRLHLYVVTLINGLGSDDTLSKCCQPGAISDVVGHGLLMVTMPYQFRCAQHHLCILTW